MNKYPSLLIVDDEVDLAEIIKDIASELFEQVHVCYNGQDALNFLDKNTVSIILSDISMPTMTGDAFLQRLRARGVFTPVVFLTGNATKEVAITAVKLGATDFLEKPFDPAQLLKTLELSIQIEEHKKNVNTIEAVSEGMDPDVLRSEKKALGIKQAVLNLKKIS